MRGEEMEQLAAHARASEADGDYGRAREFWLACLPLLPPQSPHATWIRDHLRELEAGIETGRAREHRRGWWTKRLAPLSFLVFFGFYWQLWGARLGLGFALLVLVHEMGHFIDIKRRGLPADMPMFLPGLGAYVRWNALGVPLEARAAISLAGPLAGLLAAAVCAWFWFHTGSDLWGELARTSAWFNALNLVPLWILDGSKAILPLSKLERLMVVAISAALGYVLGEWVFGLVAIGAGIRLVSHDAPEESSSATTAYFVAVLAGLALVMWLVPGHSTGVR
jgi:Zn-dependent protease